MNANSRAYAPSSVVVGFPRACTTACVDIGHPFLLSIRAVHFFIEELFVFALGLLFGFRLDLEVLTLRLRIVHLQRAPRQQHAR